MQNRYNQAAGEFQREFISKLETDKEFIRERDAFLRIQVGEIDLSGTGLLVGSTANMALLSKGKLTPNTMGGGKIGALMKAVEAIVTIKSIASNRQEKKIQQLQLSLAKRIEKILIAQRPDFAALTAEKALGYDIFLSSLRIDPFIGNNQKFLTNLQTQARIVAAQKGSAEVATDLEAIKRKDAIIVSHLKDIALYHKNILKGQQGLHKELAVLDAKQSQKSQEQAEYAAEIKSKLNNIGVVVDEKLNTLLESSQVIRAQLNTACDQMGVLVKDMQAKNEAQAIKEKFAGVADAFGFMGALAQQLGNQDLVRISTIGQAGVTVAAAVHALQGLTTMGPAMLTPWSAICGAALSIFSAFAKAGPDPHQIILDAINGLSELVYTLRKEMHERFDQIVAMLGEHHAQTLVHFTELHRQSHGLQQAIERMRQEMQQAFQATQHNFATITQDLKSIVNTQRTMGRYQSLELIYPIISEVSSQRPLSDERFEHLYHQIHSRAEVDAQKIFLVGQDGIKADVVQAFEQDANYTLCQDFNIVPLYKHALTLGVDLKDEGAPANPTLWAWETLAMMSLMKKRYPQNADALLSIHVSEIADLEKNLHKGQMTQRFLHGLRSEDVVKVLLSNHFHSGEKFKAELNKYIGEQEAMITRDLNAAITSGADCLDLFKPSASTEFYEEKFTVNAKTVAQCFTPTKGKWQPPKCPDKYDTDGPTTEGAIELARLEKLYVDNHISAIAKFKTGYMEQLKPIITAAQNNNLLQNNAFKFMRVYAAPHFHYAFIYPSDPNHPTLPMPINLKPRIPQDKLEAEWLGLGKIHINYAIVANQFVLATAFKWSDRTEEAISTISLPYNPLIYSGKEAIWWYWVGGNIPVTANDYVYSCIHEKTVDTTKYWTYGYLPAAKKVVGKRDSLQRDPNTNLVWDGAIGTGTAVRVVEITETAATKTKIQAQKREYVKKFWTDLATKLKSETTSELANALIEYSYSYYMLQAVLIKSFAQHENIQAPELGYFIPGQAVPPFTPILVRNRSDFCQLLNSFKDNRSLVEYVQHSQEYLVGKVMPCIRHLFSSNEFHTDLLDETIIQLSQLIKWYREHCVADEVNQSQQGVLAEQNSILIETNKQTREQLETIKRLILGIKPLITPHLPEEAKRNIQEMVNREVSRLRIAPSPELQRLLQFDDGNNEEKEREDKEHFLNSTTPAQSRAGNFVENSSASSGGLFSGSRGGVVGAPALKDTQFKSVAP